MIKVGIIGGAGYVAGELLRCLVHHPEVEIEFVLSKSHSGEKIASVHQDLWANTEMQFTDQIDSNVDLIFLCTGHGNSRAQIQEHGIPDEVKIIDLGSDFRLQKDSQFGQRDFVYGLVEHNKNRIESASNIANPGCFATAIQLGLLPLAKAELLQTDIHIHAITGSTGAGQSLKPTSHFSWRSNNLSIYKAFRHQHLNEINETLMRPGNNGYINFIPVRGDFTRGIFATIYMKCEWNEKELVDLYSEHYQSEPFTQVIDHTVHLKQVVNTNHCHLQIQKIDDQVLITSAIDNLLKGAAGQAIQNMNLMMGLAETTGLNFKANYF